MALIRLFLHVFDLSHSGKTVLCLKANLICGCCFLGSGPVACLVCCFFGETQIWLGDLRVVVVAGWCFFDLF